MQPNEQLAEAEEIQLNLQPNDGILKLRARIEGD
jgi:hypothetical protein